MDAKAVSRLRTLLPLFSLLILTLQGNAVQANDFTNTPTSFNPLAVQRENNTRLQSSCSTESLEASISGRVRFQDTDEPIQGVLIENLTIGEPELTDGDGRFAFTGVPYEIQTLRASFEGLGARWFAVRPTGLKPSYFLNFTLDAPAPSTVNVSGFVVDPDINRIPGAEVSRLESGSLQITNQNGYFTFFDQIVDELQIVIGTPGPPLGKQTLLFEAEGFAPEIVAIESTFEEPNVFLNTRLVPEEYLDLGVLEIEVLGPEGPQPGAVVEFSDNVAEGETDEDGMIIFEPIPLGNHELEVSLPGFEPATCDIRLSDKEPHQRVIVELQTQEDGILSGQVLDNRSGEPLADAVVRLEPVGFEDVTPSNGEFGFRNLTRGEILQVIAERDGYFPIEVEIEIPFDSPEVVLVFPLDPIEVPATVRLRGDGIPVRGASIVLAAADGRPYEARGSSDSDGLFETQPLPIGEYAIIVDADGYQDIEIVDILTETDTEIRVTLDRLIEEPTSTPTPEPGFGIGEVLGGLALVAGAGVVALAVSGFVLYRMLRRPPAKPTGPVTEPVPEGPSTQPSELIGAPPSTDLADLANKLLGSEGGVDPMAAGPTVAKLASYTGSEWQTHPLASTYFWQAYVRTADFKTLLGQAGVAEKNVQRMYIVNHGSENKTWYRYDLMVLVDEIADPDEYFTAAAESLPRNLRSGWKKFGDEIDEPGPLEEMITKASPGDIAAEMSVVQPFSVIITRAPAMELTATVPGKPIEITEANAGTSSTVGVFARDKNGKTIVTAAWHAVQNHADDSLAVGDHTARVVGHHAISDSAIVEVKGLDEKAGQKLEPKVLSPSQHEKVTFKGVRSKSGEARVVAWDWRIPSLSKSEQLDVITNPVTARGDSGAALVDEEGRLLAFAHARSAADAPNPYSSWIWARQVFSVHELEMAD